MKKIARLIIGASENCPDLLYATRFFVPDDMIWLEVDGISHAWLSPLEIDRAKKSAQIERIEPLSKLEADLRKKLRRVPTRVEVVKSILALKKIRKVEVPRNFPSYFSDGLRKLGVKIAVCEGEFFPERQIKSREEVKSITAAQRMAEAGMARGIEVLKAAKISKSRILKWGNSILTSEILRGEIDAEIARRGGLPANTIVACGKQACDPHERGHGPIRANETIVLDIFPRAQQSGYFGDLTRTVVKGKASEKILHLYQTVLNAQKIALYSMKEGVDGGKLHQSLLNYFAAEGYETKQDKGRWVGFFHGTGHSLGLEIHEPPRFAAGKFKAGHIMTVEPGLYYPSIGGVRIEDLVLIKKNGVENLTECPKQLELK